MVRNRTCKRENNEVENVSKLQKTVVLQELKYETAFIQDKGRELFYKQPYEEMQHIRKYT